MFNIFKVTYFEVLFLELVYDDEKELLKKKKYNTHTYIMNTTLGQLTVKEKN